MAEPRSTFARVVLPGVSAAALTAVAAAKEWVRLSDPGGYGMSARLAEQAIGAAGEVPLASATSLIVLAAWGVLLVTRGRVRTAFAVVGLIAALVLLGLSVLAPFTAPDSFRDRLTSQLGLGDRAAQQAHVTLTGWYWVALVASVVGVAAFAAAVRLARDWPTMSTRYDAPGAAAEGAEEPHTSQEIWKAMDEGRDPTTPTEP
jgi:uncharacterized membrane protein (TIGR02234 family)